jgi:hypothetical protein
MRQNEKCGFFGCDGILNFVSVEWHELDSKIVEKCDLAECSKCGVQGLSRSDES